jgi:hypothetical protein
MQAPRKKTAMPTVAGILSLVLGAFDLVCVLGIVISAFIVAWEPGSIENGVDVLAILIAFAVAYFVFGVLAIVGGIYCLQRKNYILSLIGAIATLLPFNPLGVAPVVLAAISRNEFEDRAKPLFSDNPR